MTGKRISIALLPLFLAGAGLLLPSCQPSAEPAPSRLTPGSLSERIAPPRILNPFYLLGGRDIPFLTADNMIKVAGQVHTLQYGEWSDEILLTLLDTPSRFVQARTAFLVTLNGKRLTYRMKPFVLTSLSRKDPQPVLVTNNTLLLVRIPQYELHLLGLDRESGEYRLLEQYRISIGRPSRPTPVTDGFVYTKGPIVLKYLYGPQQNQPILMAQIGPESPEKGPVPLDRMKGLYLSLNGDGRHMIHSTTEHWRQGAAISMGCIRLAIPEMIDLHDRTPLGTPVRIVYDTVEVADGRIRISPDIYSREGPRTELIVEKLIQAGLDRKKLNRGKIGLLAGAEEEIILPLDALLREENPAPIRTAVRRTIFRIRTRMTEMVYKNEKKASPQEG